VHSPLLERVRSAWSRELYPHSFAECCDRYTVDAWEYVQNITSGGVRITSVGISHTHGSALSVHIHAVGGKVYNVLLSESTDANSVFS
jgi:hypothetical protein